MMGYKKNNKFRKIERKPKKISDTSNDDSITSKSISLGSGALHAMIPMRFNKHYLFTVWLNRFDDEGRKKILEAIGFQDMDAEHFKKDTIATIVKETQDSTIMYELWNAINLRKNPKEKV